MKITDNSKLLKTKDVDEVFDSLLEEMEKSQNAAGPELKDDRELKNEATVETKAEPEAEEKENKDMYPEEMHKETEDVEPVEIKESEQIAAGPELKPEKELENEATEEKTPEGEEPDMENKDVYCDKTHEQETDVKPIEIKEEELEGKSPEANNAEKEFGKESEDAEAIVDTTAKEEPKEKVEESALFALLRKINESLEAEVGNEATEEKTPEASEPDTDNKDVYCDKTHEQETDVEPVEIKEAPIYSREQRAQEHAKKDMEDAEKYENINRDEEEKDRERESWLKEDAEDAGEVVDEQYNEIMEAFDEMAEYVDLLDENDCTALEEALELINEDADFEELNEGLGKFIKGTWSGIKNKVKGGYFSDGYAHSRENDAIIDSQRKRNADADKAEKEANAKSKETKKADIKTGRKNAIEAYKKALESRKALMKERKKLILQGKEADADKIRLKKREDLIAQKKQSIKDASDKAKTDHKNRIEANHIARNKAREDAGKLAKNAMDASAKTFDIKSSSITQNDKKESDRVAKVVTESEQPEKKITEPKAKELENKDIYCPNCHTQVEDVVGIVIEAAARCKKAGKAAIMKNICEEAEAIIDSKEKEESIKALSQKVNEKEYDVDASIESSEMNGSDTAFKDYEEIQGEEANAALSAEVPAEAVHESVKYGSLKEACMLDENYFFVESYIKETPKDKVEKLTEQISLLLARESMDPLYNELLKESVYCQRLEEACKAKYKKAATEKTNKILTEKKNQLLEQFDFDDFNEFLNEETLNEGIIGRFFTRLAIRLLGEKSLNNAILKAKPKAMAEAKTDEQKKAIEEKIEHLLALDKKAKKAALLELIKKAPEKDQNMAESKIKTSMEKAGVKVKSPAAMKEAWDQTGRNEWEKKDAVGVTNGDVVGMQSTISSLSAQLSRTNVTLGWVIALSSLIAVALVTVLVFTISKNIELSR